MYLGLTRVQQRYIFLSLYFSTIYFILGHCYQISIRAIFASSRGRGQDGVGLAIAISGDSRNKKKNKKDFELMEPTQGGTTLRRCHGMIARLATTNRGMLEVESRWLLGSHERVG